jgi:hypothetical protein
LEPRTSRSETPRACLESVWEWVGGRAATLAPEWTSGGAKFLFLLGKLMTLFGPVLHQEQISGKMNKIKLRLGALGCGPGED